MPRMQALHLSAGELSMLMDCCALATACRVPSSRRAVVARALRSTLIGLTREATRAGLDPRAVILAARAKRAEQYASRRLLPRATACPPPDAPNISL